MKNNNRTSKIILCLICIVMAFCLTACGPFEYYLLDENDVVLPAKMELYIGEEYLFDFESIYGGFKIINNSPELLDVNDTSISIKIKPKAAGIGSFTIVNGKFESVHEIVIPKLIYINEIQDFKLINLYKGYDFILDNDVSLSEEYIETQYEILGTFDGNNHILTVGYIGHPLFSDIKEKAVIKNLNIEQCTLKTEDINDIGIVTGINNGLIDNVNVLGSKIEAPSAYHIGGIAGVNAVNGIVKNCTVNCTFDKIIGKVGAIIGGNKAKGQKNIAANQYIGEKHVDNIGVDYA